MDYIAAITNEQLKETLPEFEVGDTVRVSCRFCNTGVEVIRHGKVRRAKLFYLRDRVGKASKVKEKI